MTRLAFGAVSLLLVSLPTGASSDGAGNLRLKLTPERIEMGSFYSGARVRIEGVVGEGSEAIVVVRGSDRQEAFNQKGRVGPIWLNAGSVRISGAPSLFLCFSPRPVGALLDAAVVGQRLLDEASIRSHLHVDPAQTPEKAAEIRSDFLDLKSEDGLYRSYPGGLKMGASGAEGTPFATEFEWPKIAPPASYTVRLLECRDRKVIAEFSVPLEVVKVGFPQSFAVLATQHAPYYGAFAVLVAACAGFAIDFLAARLFGRRRVVGH